MSVRRQSLIGRMAITFDMMDQQLLSAGSTAMPPLVELKISVPGTGLSKLVKPPSPEALWEWYSSTGMLDADPSWADVWPTGAALAELIVDRPDFVQGKRVAEIGSGLGLGGLVAASLGARCVTFLDREPFALHCAMSSASLNGFQTAPVSRLAEQPSEPETTGLVRASVFDWQDPCLGDDVDVVIATDVLYDLAAVRSLPAAIAELLQHHGRAILVDPANERSPGCRVEFVKHIADSGGEVSIEDAGCITFPDSSFKLLDCRWNRLDS